MILAKCASCKKSFHYIPDPKDVQICLKCLSKREKKEDNESVRRLPQT